jgi:uncharacterized damage-inducible protein DinB
MNRISEFLNELNNEAKTTRKMLSVVPDDKYDWKPHPRSMTIRVLAGHIAELPTWIGMVLNTTELDFASAPYNAPEINHTNDLLQLFEKSLADGQQQFAQAKDESLDEIWTLRNGEQIFSSEPKNVMIRATLSQIIHHRAQLGVFLRLLDVKIPGSYGPSADDENFN